MYAPYRYLRSLAVALTLVLVWTGSASAERLTSAARLRATPGERGRTVIELTPGTTVRVLERSGRWVKVSARGKVGWVTRTQLGEKATASKAKPKRSPKRAAMTKSRSKKGWQAKDDIEVGADAVEEEEVSEEEEASEDAFADSDEEESRPSKRKPSRSAVGEGDVVLVKRDAAVRTRPATKADEMYEAAEGEEMTVLAVADDGEWVQIEDSDGAKGWMRSDDLSADDFEGSSTASADDEPATDAEEEEESDASARSPGVTRKLKKGKFNYELNAGAGFLYKMQEFQSDGMGVTGDYGLKNTVPTVSIQARALRPYGAKMTFGAEGGFMTSFAGSGVAVPNSDTSLSWKHMSYYVDGLGAYKLTDRYSATMSIGYHAYYTSVGQDMTLKMPSENLSGFQVSAGAEGRGFKGGKLSFRGGLRFLLAPKLAQSTGAREGDRTAATSMGLYLTGVYRLTDKIDGVGGYELGIDKVAFSGVNERDATATNGKRSDMSHMLTIGARYVF